MRIEPSQRGPSVLTGGSQNASLLSLRIHATRSRLSTTGRGPSPEPDHTGPLISDLAASRTVGIKPLLLKPLVCGICYGRRSSHS